MKRGKRGIFEKEAMLMAAMFGAMMLLGFLAALIIGYLVRALRPG